MSSTGNGKVSTYTDQIKEQVLALEPIKKYEEAFVALCREERTRISTGIMDVDIFFIRNGPV